MSAKRPPGDQSYISAPQLTSCLNKDLKGNVFVTPPHFFLDLLWPSKTSPIPLNKNIFEILTANKAWDDVHDQFPAPKSFTEIAMADWLNTLGSIIGIFAGGVVRKRVWCAGNHNKQPDGSSINRKPDITLIDKTMEGHVSWTMIHAFAEVTTSSPFPKRIYSTINDKSYLMFISQHDRRFVPALSFDGQGMFALTITDRQGQISMPPISLLHGKGNALILMKILAYLMFGPLHNTGRDSTMELNEDQTVKSISVNGNWYDVVHVIYSLQSMIGRGTTIWLVFRHQQYFILKDSWIQTSRVQSEITFLEILKNDSKLKNRVPNIVEGQDVEVGGVVDSTGRYRELVGGMRESRIHRRLVMTPIGTPITRFGTKAEFICAIIDVIDGK
jgi:hypothetical protein